MSEQSDRGASEARRARKATRQSFGSVRKLASGRVQARYPDVKGRPMTAPITFATKQDALDYLAGVRADRMRGSYHDHRAGRVMTFDRFAAEWIANGGSRGKLAPRTTATYRDLLAQTLAYFEGMPIAAITPPEVRTWYSATRKALAKSAVKRGGTGETRLRQGYALLRAIMTTAVGDGLAAENPCKIMGAGVAESPERPMLEPNTLALIVERMPEHYRFAIMVMFAAHLRLGELVALRRGDFDSATGTMRVERQTIEVEGQTMTTATKTGEARLVALPPTVAAMLREHLADTRGFGGDPMFTRSLTARERSLTTLVDPATLVDRRGVALTRAGIQQAWRKATTALSLTRYHVHDVRHAGLTTAAQAGATTRELMARAGHRTTRAAMLYQHAAEGRNAIVAEGMESLSGGLFGSPYGTTVARNGIPAIAVGSEGESEKPG